MAEIKVTDKFGKRARRLFDYSGETERSALFGMGGSAFTSLDAGGGAVGDRISPQNGGSIREMAAGPSQEKGSGDSQAPDGPDSPRGISISFGPGAIVVGAQKSPQEIARDIVKPLSRELKKLGYLSS